MSDDSTAFEPMNAAELSFLTNGRPGYPTLASRVATMQELRKRRTPLQNQNLSADDYARWDEYLQAKLPLVKAKALPESARLTGPLPGGGRHWTPVGSQG
jgi:hypothetical protein